MYYYVLCDDRPHDYRLYEIDLIIGVVVETDLEKKVEVSTRDIASFYLGDKDDDYSIYVDLVSDDEHSESFIELSKGRKVKRGRYVQKK